ncbi:MAG: sensor histidine kinase [Salinivirgaceae bacterium]
MAEKRIKWPGKFAKELSLSAKERELFHAELDKKNLINFRLVSSATFLIVVFFCFMDTYLQYDNETQYAVNLVRIVFAGGFLLPFVIYSFTKKTKGISQFVLIVNILTYGVFLFVLSLLSSGYPQAVAHHIVAFYLINIALYLLFGIRQYYAYFISMVFLIAINYSYWMLELAEDVAVNQIDLNIWFVLVTIVGALASKHNDNLLAQSFRANMEIKRLNESKYRLFSMVSHDLKNMISVQYTISDCLKDQTGLIKSVELDRMIELLYRSTNDVVSVFEDLMTWIKTQMNAITPQYKDVNLDQFTDTILTQMHPIAQAKQVQLKLEHEGVKTVKTDAHIVGLVLRNIIGNAIKYSNAEGLVQIRCKVSQAMLEYEVSDSGQGMTAEKVAELFNMESFQSSRGTSGEKGTGLGLLLSKELLSFVDGNIHVFSELHKGTRVVISIPLRH